MKSANPGHGRKITSSNKIKRFSGSMQSLPTGQKTSGGAKGSDNLMKNYAYDKKGGGY